MKNVMLVFVLMFVTLISFGQPGGPGGPGDGPGENPPPVVCDALYSVTSSNQLTAYTFNGVFSVGVESGTECSGDGQSITVEIVKTHGKDPNFPTLTVGGQSISGNGVYTFSGTSIPITMNAPLSNTLRFILVAIDGDVNKVGTGVVRNWITGYPGN